MEPDNMIDANEQAGYDTLISSDLFMVEEDTNYLPTDVADYLHPNDLEDQD